MKAALLLAYPQAFGEEDEIQLAPLNGFSEMPERRKSDLTAGCWIAPDREIIDARKLRSDDDLFLRLIVISDDGQAAATT